MALKLGATLVSLGYEVVPVLRGGGPRVDEFAVLGPVHRDRLRLLGSAVRRIPGATWLADRLEEVAAWITLRRVDCGLVWCNSMPSLAYVRPALLLGRRVVVHSHEVDPVASAALRRFRSHRWGGRVIPVACSEAAATILARELGVTAAEVSVVLSTPDPPIGIVGAPTHSERPVAVVAGCGVPTVAKGLDMFVALARSSHDEQLRWRWIGGVRPRWVPVAAPVEFVPPVVDVRERLMDVGLFVLTSRGESASLVILEAMSIGIPVVAFNVGGVAEIVGDAGVLISPGDLEGMASAISELLRDPDRLRELSDRGLARARALCDPERWRASVEGVLT